MKKFGLLSVTALSVFSLVACSEGSSEETTNETTEVTVTTVQSEESQETSSVSREFKNALATAEDYIDFSAFSKEGLYDQLLFEKFPEDAARYAVDTINVDWNEQALKSAKDYLEFSSFSDEGLKEQLLFEKFTDTEAQYAIDHLDN